MNVEQKAAELFIEELAKSEETKAGVRRIQLGFATDVEQAALRAIARALEQPECTASPSGKHEEDADGSGHVQSPGWCSWCSEQFSPQQPEGRVIGYVERFDAGYEDIRRLHGADGQKLVQRIPFGYPVAILPTGVNNWHEQPEGREAVAPATLPVVIRGRSYDVPIPVQLRIVALEDALGARGAKPICYLRTLNGAPDWAEDCVCEEPGVVLQYYDEADGYGEMPLYATTTPPAKVSEGARVMPGQRAALGDMGEGTRLSIYRQEDGDLIVSVIEPGMRFNPVSVEFCTPGSGGGKNSALYWALSAVHAAMPAFDIAAQQPKEGA